MSDNTPSWFRALRLWQGSGEYGLSIPMLVGIERKHGVSLSDVNHVERILTEARDVDLALGGYIALSYCHEKLQRWIVRVVDNSSIPESALSLPSNDGQYRLAMLNPKQGILDFEDVADELWSDAEDAISAGSYSCRTGRACSGFLPSDDWICDLDQPIEAPTRSYTGW